MIRPWILEESNFAALKNSNYELAVLPWGAMEAHNYHLPYGTDSYEAKHIAYESARIAWEEGAKCLVLPTLPFGVNTGQSDIPGTINLYPSTQGAILNNIIESLWKQKIPRLLVLNSHGGNDFRQLLRESGASFPKMLLLTANWFQSVNKKDFFEEDGDHADEMETSLMLHLEPRIVLPLDEAGDGAVKDFNSEMMHEHWNWSERKWSKVSKDTGIGNPKKGSAEKGKAYFDAVCNKVARLLIEVSKLDPENPYK